MASSSTPNGSGRSKPPDSEDNPFIAFRRFADDQISSALHILIGLPSALVRPSGTGLWHSLEQQRQRQQQQRPTRDEMPWNVSPSKSDTLGGHSPGSSCATTLRDGHDLHQRSESDEEMFSAPRDSDVHDDFNRRLGFYVEPHWSRWDGCMEEYLGLPSRAAQRPWTLGYILWSPYSPIQLERSSQYRETKWREAFEDLIAATEGRELEGHPPEPLTDLYGWICRVGMRSRSPDWEAGVTAPMGLLLSIFPEMNCGLGIPPVEDSQGGSHVSSRTELLSPTELDLYSRSSEEDEEFSKPSTTSDEAAVSVTKAVQRSFWCESYATSKTEEDKEERPSVVATLTTTERITNADGKIHTTVVLKKRFADGSEETSETTHTAHAPPGLRDWPSGYDDLFRQEKEGLRRESVLEDKVAEILSKAGESKEEPKKRNWFWSG